MHIVLTGQEDKLSVWGSRISQMQDKCHQFHVLLFVWVFFLKKIVLPLYH